MSSTANTFAHSKKEEAHAAALDHPLLFLNLYAPDHGTLKVNIWHLSLICVLTARHHPLLPYIHLV